MTDFSPAQMQEMAKRLKSDGVFMDEADALEQAASQAAEIERLRVDAHELTVIGGYVGERGVTDASTPLYIRVLNIIERMEAAESRLLALREQVEGLQLYTIRGHAHYFLRADVLAVFDPAKEGV